MDSLPLQCHVCGEWVGLALLEPHALSAHVGEFSFWKCGECEFQGQVFAQLASHCLQRDHEATKAVRHDHWGKLLDFLGAQQAFLRRVAPPPTPLGPNARPPSLPASDASGPRTSTPIQPQTVKVEHVLLDDDDDDDEEHGSHEPKPTPRKKAAPRLACKRCGATAVGSVGRLAAHVLLNHKRLSGCVFVCPQIDCGRSFRDKAAFTKHRHTGQRGLSKVPKDRALRVWDEIMASFPDFTSKLSTERKEFMLQKFIAEF